MAIRTMAQLSVKSMSRNLVDTIRLFCTVAIIVAAIAQLITGLTEPVIFMLSTVVAALAIILPVAARSFLAVDNTNS